MTEYLPCPHGRSATDRSHGWQSCPHCMGLSSLTQPTQEEIKTLADQKQLGWEEDKPLDDFLTLADNLQASGQTSRAEAVRYLIHRAKQAKQAAILECVEALGKNREEGKGDFSDQYLLGLMGAITSLKSLLTPGK